MLIEITHTYGGGQDDYGSEDCSISHKEVTLKELLEKASDYELQQWGLARLDKNKDKPINPTTAATLKALGWSRVDVAKDREEKKVLEQEYYILDENGNRNWTYKPAFGLIDMDNVKDDTLDQLANGARIVQKVSARSVLRDADYKKYLTKMKQKQAAIDKAKKTKETKEQNKKQKEIEKAKMLLQEAGVLK